MITVRMDDCRQVATPMEVNFHIDENEPILQIVPYRRLICSLMYLAIISRPDISYSVTILSQYLDKPYEKAWQAGKRIMRYLSGTKNYGLRFMKGDSGLIGMCDADWGGDRETRRSVSGFVGFYANNPIAWHSRKQPCVALSSMEAEYVSAATASQELINLSGVLSDFGECNLMTLKIDNLSTVSYIKTFENSKRSKHIDIRFHFIKDLYFNKRLKIEYVSSSENIADMFTKPLSKEKFQYFRSKLLYD